MKIVFDIYKKNFMKHLKIFIELTRLNKPIGFMLLFWPCSWGLAYAYLINQNTKLFIYYLILFFFGSVLMRSAGCIVNDIVDKDLDKKVKRTKTRPLAAGKISVKQSLFYVLVLCLLAFLILIQFNFLTIFLGIGSMFLAFSYPFMKRITYWPQLFLGITFNWGIIMAWTAINNGISLEIIILYVSAIFWTLGYDTIYGAQDVSDDEIIGIKSTSIKFKNNIIMFVTICYVLTFISLAFLLRNNFGLNITTILFVIFNLSLLNQILNLKDLKKNNFLKIFKSNNTSGLILFFAILTTNL
jgi:4-hydroxybenzoate polyprenyltransferase